MLADKKDILLNLERNKKRHRIILNFEFGMHLNQFEFGIRAEKDGEPKQMTGDQR